MANNSNSNNGPKRRGRAKGSTTPVTLQVLVACSDAERMSLRLENAVDDGSAEVGMSINLKDNGFSATITAADGGNGRIARQAIAKTLKKWHEKGKIASASILTNPIHIG